ncbi:unnamed protein product [Ilex paraguariensis]|uniref:Uncharacterized protein n=1 Tax=Ilex paraguariensis TaxID=185542 RepID=A0ABC8R8J4_9AQUA
MPERSKPKFEGTKRSWISFRTDRICLKVIEYSFVALILFFTYYTQHPTVAQELKLLKMPSFRQQIYNPFLFEVTCYDYATDFEYKMFFAARLVDWLIGC